MSHLPSSSATHTNHQSWSEIAQDYAEGVVSGKIPAGRWVKLACQRNLDDWDKEDSEAFPYRWDTAKADHVCDFLSLLPLVKAKGANSLLKLEPWQVWIVTNVFAWVHKDGPRAGKRRFRRVYLEIPRKNGKSSLTSGVSLYMLAADGEPGADVYSAATTHNQARIVFDDARAMVKHPLAADLMAALGIKPWKNTITVEATNSRFMALSADAHTLDGLNIHFAAVDEFHEHKTRSVWDVLVTACAAREQSLIWAITTAGFNLEGVCYQEREYLTKVLEGFDADSLFGCIWSADEGYGVGEHHIPGDDWRLESTWRKANPNWNVSIDGEFIAGEFKQAAIMPYTQKNFLTKYLNLWQTGHSSWADMPSWNRQLDTSLNIENYYGKKCYIGFDMSSRHDLTAVSLLFPEMRTEEDGREHQHIVCFSKFLLPEETIQSGKNASYAGWHKQGYLLSCGIQTIEYKLFEELLLSFREKFKVQEYAYDDWKTESIGQSLNDNGAKTVIVSQGIKSSSEPSKELDSLVRTGRFHYDNPILKWCASNVACYEDPNGNIKLRKESSNSLKKVDGIHATTNALSRIMYHKPVTSIYEKRGIIVLS